jgi:protein crumbs
MCILMDYSCTCPDGLTGPNCEEDINECQDSEGNEDHELCNNGICVNEFPGYQCFCRPGFTGVKCDFDFDECLLQKCLNNATCVDKENAYHCNCVPGFEGKYEI